MADADLRVVPPHDDRYGRLFPDGDVGNILAAVLPPEEVAKIDLDQLGAHFTFPVGEPMFVLRASDDGALSALRTHLEDCEGFGYVEDDYIAAVKRAIMAFETWALSRGA
jgi:hypothetical protein